MRWIGRVSVVALATAVVIAAGVGGASAGTARRAVHLVPANVPTGYEIATSSIVVDAGTQAGGSATCQTGDVVLGGGAEIVSDNVGADINSSWPKNNHTWGVIVNNGDSIPTNVTIYAVCAHKPKGYQVVKDANVVQPSGTFIALSAVCPSGKKVLGGGSRSESTSLQVAEGTSLPDDRIDLKRFTWLVEMNNVSGADESFHTFAICGKPDGYKLKNGSEVTVPGGKVIQASVDCPSGTVPLGGGTSPSSTPPDVNINTTEPNNVGWDVYEANASSTNVMIRATVACAS